MSIAARMKPYHHTQISKRFYAAAQKTRAFFIILSLLVAMPLLVEFSFAKPNAGPLPINEAFRHNSALLWIHGTSDIVIGTSYLLIAAALVYLAYISRHDKRFLYIFSSSSSLVVGCALVYFISLWNIWHSNYYALETLRIFSSLASLVTGIILMIYAPTIRRLIESGKRTYKREMELEALTKKLSKERADLLALNASKDEFISLASHQLRTPATGVKQYIGMMMEGFAGEITQQQKMMLEKAYESNERQLGIISDLLNIARIDSGKVVLEKNRTNLNMLLKDVVNEQSGKIEANNQQISVKLPDHAVYLQVDGNRMRMVLENLLDNASKYSPPNTTIYLQVKETMFGVEISIKDQGVGIARKDMPKLFQKFSRVSNPLSQKAGGSGLGLYWVKRVIDMHKGTIEVNSKLNKGTTFVVSLPKRGFKHE